jgi:aryl-alcohol dehydrogenase-like predicted oxidoreductase
MYSPLAHGMLAGRYRKGQPPASPRMNWVPRYLTDERVLDIANSPPALRDTKLRRRPFDERSAA